jgi:hypothetical protein
MCDSALDATEYAARRHRRRVARAIGRDSPDVWRRPPHQLDIGDGRANIFPRDERTGELVDMAGKSRQHLGGLAGSGVRQNDGLAAAVRQARHDVLVAHALGEPQNVGQRRVEIDVGRNPTAAHRRTCPGAVQRDDRTKTGLRIAAERNRLMTVEFRCAENHRPTSHNASRDARLR